jgi:diguanylate cyclase (GGDEF)-like protein
MSSHIESRGALGDLLVFHELARSLTSTLDLNTILTTTLKFMDRFINAELWALLMLDPERQELYYFSPDGTTDPQQESLRVKVGEGLAGWVAQNGETLIIPEAATDPRMKVVSAGQVFTVRSAIGLPIRGNKGTYGVLEIFNPHFDENPEYNIAFLHILVDYAAIALDNAKEVARAQELTLVDDATGLFNARYLYTVLERELDSARRDSKPVSLVFLDLDRFKIVNDRYGHLIGTELLSLVGRRIRKLSRGSDLCFRDGGEEALRLARSIHLQLAQNPFILRNGLQITINASAGIATYPGDGRTVHAILGAADQRMYTVKGTGRGRVEA